MNDEITHNEEDKIIPGEDPDNLNENTAPENIPEENITPDEKSHDILPVENIDEDAENTEVNNPEQEESIEKETRVEENEVKSETEVPQEKISEIPEISGESNYQVSLINENLLRIRVSTIKSVSIDCTVKDVSATGGDASESQSNKIQIHPKPDSKPQEVEIIISIDPESGNIVVEKKKIISRQE